MKPYTFKIDPDLDLVLERIIDVPRDLVWKAWTTPEHLKQWFCPKPFEVSHLDMDVRPGGKFNTSMIGPGFDQPMVNKGCYLEVIEGERLTFTSCLSEGFRPVHKVEGCHDMPFTAALSLADHNGGTKYTVYALNPTPEAAKKHAEMGFEHGWGTALDQLVEMIKDNKIQ